MINNDTAKSTYTVTEGVTEYPIGFQYTTNPDGTPNLYVWHGDDTELEYGTDYTLSADGLSIELLSPVEADETLSVAVDEPFIQDSDYVVGRIDPEQIERDFDKSVLRDLQLRDYADDINDRLADEVQARTDADTALQDAIDDEVAARSLADTTLQDNIDAEADAREDADDALQAAINTKQDTIADLATIRSGAVAGATAVQPNDLASVATSGSYNDLSNKPTLGSAAAANTSDFATAAQGAKADTAVQPGTLATVATSGSYNDLTNKPTIPTVGDATITIKQGGVTKGTFSVNQTNDGEINLESGGGGGTVDSVNGKTGVVVLNASDVGAATAAQGAKADTAVQPAAIANMQTTSNLVTSVSSVSTDTQYPSAKLFYETCGDIESLINAL